MTEGERRTPKDWVPRTDAGARKLIERLDVFTKQVNYRLETIEEDIAEQREFINDQQKAIELAKKKMKRFTTKGRVAAMIATALAGVAGMVFTIAWGVSTFVASRSEKHVDSAVSGAKTQILDGLADVKTTDQTENREIYKSVRTKKPSAILQQPVVVDGGSP